MDEATLLSPVVFPNPFTEQATLLFSNVGGAPFTLVIYDLLGNEVYEKGGITENKVVLDRNDLAPGLFLYELQNGQEMYCGRMIVE